MLTKKLLHPLLWVPIFIVFIIAIIFGLITILIETIVNHTK